MKNRCIKFDYLYIIFYSIYFIQNPPATYPKLFDGLSYLFYFLYCRNTLKSYALYLFPKNPTFHPLRSCVTFLQPWCCDAMDVPLANKDVPLLFSLHFGVDASIGIMPFFSTESISWHLLLISGNPEALTFSLPLSIGCENAYSGTVAGREFPKLWKKQTNQTFEVKSFFRKFTAET